MIHVHRMLPPGNPFSQHLNAEDRAVSRKALGLVEKERGEAVDMQDKTGTEIQNEYLSSF